MHTWKETRAEQKKWKHCFGYRHQNERAKPKTGRSILVIGTKTKEKTNDWCKKNESQKETGKKNEHNSG